MATPSLKTAALAFLPALSLMAACQAPEPAAPPARVTIAAPEWVARFDSRANKRQCDVTDRQTGETYSRQRQRGTEALGPDFRIGARRLYCDVTEVSTGITCSFYGRSGIIDHDGRSYVCTAPNPIASQAQAITGNVPAMVAALR